MTSSSPRLPLRIAVVDDCALVVAGLASILEPFADRVSLVELDGRAPAPGEVDIVLLDPLARRQGADRASVPHLRARPGGPAVVVFSWSTRPHLVEAALDAGAAGYIAKTVGGEELVEALEQAATGTVPSPRTGGPPRDARPGLWPGAEHGLSAREAEVLALLCQGLSNQEIAERAYIGLNTVKSHLRVLFQKIGVDSRTRAALWGVDHRFRTVRLPAVDSPGANGIDHTRR